MDKSNYLLILNAGNEYSKKFMLSDICHYTRPIALITKKDISWEKQYIDAEIHTDSYNDEDVWKAVEAFSRNNSIQGILTYNEKNVLTAAFLSKKLGLIGLSKEAGLCARNKNLMRSAFERNGVPSAKSLLIHSLDEAEKFILANGYPVVLKPVMGASSIAVVKVDSHGELLVYFDHVRRLSKEKYDSEELLIEEYLDGKEVSVESVVYNGKVTVVMVTDKFKSAEPFFEEVGHTMPSNLPESVAQLVKDVAIAGMKALGIRNGVTHSEVKITSQGPKIVEIAARPAGCFIPKLVELSTGVNIGRALVDVSLGREPNLKHTKSKVNSVRFFVPEKEGVLLGHGNIDKFKKIDWVKEFKFTGEIGNKITLPPDKYYTRLGHYIIEAGDRAEMDERLNFMSEEFKLEIFEGL